MSIINGIGSTPLVELKRVVPSGSARVFAKLEFTNPTGSMKDRMALAAIQAAEVDGRLIPGGTVVEYTGGTTGVSLAFICAAKGYPIKIVFSDAFSQEKKQMMRAFGAEVSSVPSHGKGITEKLIKTMIDEARQLSQESGHWWVDQLNNQDAIRGYHSLGDEIWEQTEGKVNAFVHSVGTAHSILGVSEALWNHNREIEIIAVEPEESAVLGGNKTGSHNIEGIGIGFLPPLWNPDQINSIKAVSTNQAKDMARRLASEEGIFAGTSSGANLTAALQVAKRLGPESNVVTLVIDSGLRYLKSDLYRK